MWKIRPTIDQKEIYWNKNMLSWLNLLFRFIVAHMGCVTEFKKKQNSYPVHIAYLF